MTTTAVYGLARCKKTDIDAVYEATKDATKPQVHVFIATSPIHLEHKLKMTQEEVIASIIEHVSYAKELFEVVQFSPEDATRTEIPFLSDNQIIFSAHCHDDLGMAVSNSLAAIEDGARRIEGTINGIGERAGNAALEEVALALYVRKDHYYIESKINLKETKKTSDLISRYAGIRIPRNKAIVGQNAFSHESGIHQDGILKHRETYEIMTPQLVGVGNTELPLGKLSGKHAFSEKFKALGYDISTKDQVALFKQFKEVADKKKKTFLIETFMQLFTVLNMNKVQYIKLRTCNFNMCLKACKVLL